MANALWPFGQQRFLLRILPLPAVIWLFPLHPLAEGVVTAKLCVLATLNRDAECLAAFDYSHLGELCPKAGLAAVRGPKAIGKDLMAVKGAVIRDGWDEGLALKEMPNGMLIAAVTGALQRVLDHGASQQRGGERMLGV